MTAENNLPEEIKAQIVAEAAKRYRWNSDGIHMQAGYVAGATAYATLLHQSQSENQRLQQENERLRKSIQAIIEQNRAGNGYSRFIESIASEALKQQP